MIRLLVRDLRRHAMTWTWTCVVAVAAGGCVSGELMAMHGAMDIARATGDAQMVQAADVAAAFILVTVSLTAMTVLSSTSSRVVAGRKQAHGLWRALGMRPGTLRAVLLGQLAAVGVTGSLGGTALGLPLARLLQGWLIDQNMILPGARPHWLPVDPLICAVVVAGSVMVGGWAASRRASHAQIVDLLSGREDRGTILSVRRLAAVVLRLLCVSGCLVGALAVQTAIRHGRIQGEDAIGASFGAAILILVGTCLVVPWLVPAVLRVLALLPLRGASWRVATRSAALESQRSSATVLPFLVAIGIVGVLYGLNNAADGNLRATGFMSMFGPSILTAWAGGVAVIAMEARPRRRDAALLRAAGAQDREVLQILLIEGLIHAVAAIALGTTVAVCTSVLMAGATGQPTSQVVAHGPWPQLGVVGGLTLVTTCVAVLASSRLGGHQSLGQQLRAKD